MQQLRIQIGALGLAICIAGPVCAQETTRLNDVVIASFLAEHLPEAIPLLAQAKDLDPEGYEVELKQVSGRIREYRRLLKQSPEVADALVRSYRLEFQAKVLSKDLAGIPEGKEREERLAELQPLLEEIFDLRMKPPEMEIEIMERRIGEIKDALDRKRNAKDRIVGQRLKALREGNDSTSEWW